MGTGMRLLNQSGNEAVCLWFLLLKVFCLLCVYTKPMYILLNTTKFSKLNTHVHTQTYMHNVQYYIYLCTCTCMCINTR